MTTATTQLHHLIHTEQINLNLVIRELGLTKDDLFEKIEANQFNAEELKRIRQLIKEVIEESVSNTGDQTISDTKTFTSSPVVPAPSAGTHAINKDYADAHIAAGIAFKLDKAPAVGESFAGLTVIGSANYEESGLDEENRLTVIVANEIDVNQLSDLTWAESQAAVSQLGGQFQLPVFTYIKNCKQITSASVAAPAPSFVLNWKLPASLDTSLNVADAEVIVPIEIS